MLAAVTAVPGSTMSAVDPRLQRTLASYDAAATAYQEAWRQHRPMAAVKRFAGMAGRNARVIDVASGPALDVRLLRDAGLKVVAGDLSHEAMRVSRLLHPKGSLVRWDLRNLPFDDAVFAGVWAPAALQHLPRSETISALAEVRRVHRSGPIFLTFMEGKGDLEPVEDPPAGTVYAITVTAEELRALLLGAGYGEVEVETRPDPLERRDITWLHGWGLVPA